MKTTEEILALLNSYEAYNFNMLLEYFGYDIFTHNKVLNDNDKLLLVSETNKSLDMYYKLKELNITIIFKGEIPTNRDLVQIVISINNQLYATNGYYSSYENDDFNNDWFLAKCKIIEIKTYEPINK